jgi:hypothetical protein
MSLGKRGGYGAAAIMRNTRFRNGISIQMLGWWFAEVYVK